MSAKRLDFIDPYFDPTHPDELDRNRWKASVRHFSEYLRESNRLTIDIHFHTAWDGKREPDSFVRSIADEISGRFPPTTSLFVSAWSKKHQGIRFHARYLLSDKAGVALDYGTDMGKDRRTDITLLPLSATNERRIEFDPSAPTTFNLEATCRIQGRR